MLRAICTRRVVALYAGEVIMPGYATLSFCPGPKRPRSINTVQPRPTRRNTSANKRKETNLPSIRSCFWILEFEKL